jgi:hypothetical protein
VSAEPGCKLYDMVRETLRKEFPEGDVRQPTALLWRIFDPQLANALTVDAVLAYVVYDSLVSGEDINAALSIAAQVVPEGRVVVFAHTGAKVDGAVQRDLRPEREEVRFISGCPCGGPYGLAESKS